MANIRKVARCDTCFLNILNDSEHICNPESVIVSSFRTNVYSKPLYRLFNVQSDDLYFLDSINRKFEKIGHGDQLLSPATNGIMTFDEDDSAVVATYSACKLQEFSIIFVAMDRNDYQMFFRVVVTANNGLVFHMMDSKLTADRDRFILPDEYKMNTALILGTQSGTMQFQVFCGANESMVSNGYSCFVNRKSDCSSTYGISCRILNTLRKDISHWRFSADSSYDADADSSYDASHTGETPVNNNNKVFIRGATIVHDTAGEVSHMCETLASGGMLKFSHQLYENGMPNSALPLYYLRCYRCLVISHDGSGHTSPCMPINTISKIRSDIYMKSLHRMVQLRLKRSHCDMHYLNMVSGRFESLSDIQSLFCPAVDGIFAIKTSEDYSLISYRASTFMRFSIAIAVLINGSWRLRFRIVTSAVHGLLVFKMRSTLVLSNGRFALPNEFKLNTVLILGIKPKKSSFEVNFRVFANDVGQIDPVNFNGYYGDATWEELESHIDKNIDGEKPKSKIKFDNRLYEARQEPVMPFRSQRFDC